jgi:NADP-dependent 3-hydroxy acid dehydrogenase YdfG
VETESSRVRFGGDEQRAAAVYERVTPLSAAHMPDCMTWAETRPPHVDVDEVVVTARAQVPGFGQQIHRK